jgi:hypothetical protein
VKQSRIAAGLFAGALAAAGVGESLAQAAVGAGIGWGWGAPAFGPYAPYGYGPYGHGWVGPFGPCGVAGCIDDPYLRRAIRRELEQQELRRELEERARSGFPGAGPPAYGLRRDPAPPTPESQLQPAYRGTGEIRPEFRDAGQARPESTGPTR